MTPYPRLIHHVAGLDEQGVGLLKLTSVLSYRRLSDQDYSDDEDMSWKVRRAAIKTLSAAVRHYDQQLPELYAQLCPTLVARFREREETVKADVFAAFTELLQQVSQLRMSPSCSSPRPCCQRERLAEGGHP